MNPKLFLITTFLFWGGFLSQTHCQSGGKDFPSFILNGAGGTTVDTREFGSNNQPVLLFFWTTWCHHSREGLEIIQDEFLDDWGRDYGLRMIGISIDDARNSVKVWPYVASQGWEFENYHDENSDLKRALGVNDPPQIILFSEAGKVIFQKQGYAAGDEEIINDKLKATKLREVKDVQSMRVWGNCGMCKRTIEKAANSVKGVISADWNQESDNLTIEFDRDLLKKGKVDMQKVGDAIAKAGYDNEKARSSDKAYSNLPGCCQYERPQN